MKDIVGDAVKVKAAGGIRTLAQALAYLDLGVDRIGSTAGVTIVNTLIDEVDGPRPALAAQIALTRTLLLAPNSAH
jgi:phosphoribosylformimino-5-aminoimidazole carboxamide ribonucleotide (ProFAR) isomerase